MGKVALRKKIAKALQRRHLATITAIVLNSLDSRHSMNSCAEVEVSTSENERSCDILRGVHKPRHWLQVRVLGVRSRASREVFATRNMFRTRHILLISGSTKGRSTRNARIPLQVGVSNGCPGSERMFMPVYAGIFQPRHGQGRCGSGPPRNRLQPPRNQRAKGELGSLAAPRFFPFPLSKGKMETPERPAEKPPIAPLSLITAS